MDSSQRRPRISQQSRLEETKHIQVAQTEFTYDHKN